MAKENGNHKCESHRQQATYLDVSASRFGFNSVLLADISHLHLFSRTGGLVSKAWSKFFKYRWNCITPTRPYKHWIRHCLFLQITQSLLIVFVLWPTPVLRSLTSLRSVERTANFSFRGYFQFFSSKRSSVFWVTKYTPAFIARPLRTSFIDSVFPCATPAHARLKSTILKCFGPGAGVSKV